jgi:hypothetical protein
MNESNNITMSVRGETDVIDDNQVQEKPNTQPPMGLCLLQQNNIIMLNNITFSVHRFTKKVLVLSLQDKTVKINDKFKIGEIFNIKNGIFKLNSFGSEFMNLQAVPGSHIFDSNVIEKMRKEQIKKSQKLLKV